jgi:hypothetical protein
VPGLAGARLLHHHERDPGEDEGGEGEPAQRHPSAEGEEDERRR